MLIILNILEAMTDIWWFNDVIVWHKNSTCRIALVSGLGCRTNGNVDMCNACFMFYYTMWSAVWIEFWQFVCLEKVFYTHLVIQSIGTWAITLTNGFRNWKCWALWCFCTFYHIPYTMQVGKWFWCLVICIIKSCQN